MQVIAPVFPWKKATFLHERATAKGGAPSEGNDSAREEAERRADAWRQLMSGDDATLDERLSSVGLDRQAFLQLLAHSGGQDDEPEDSGSWVFLIQEVIEQRHAGEALPTSLQAPSSPGQPGLSFSGLLHPFLRIATARLRTSLAALQARHGLERPILAPEAEAALLEGLARRLQFLATRTLILELNVARMLEQLPGDSPQERFHYFSTRHLGEPRVLVALLEEYPVLARLLATSTERWLDVSLELLQRLVADHELLGQTFLGGQDIGLPTGLQSGISDLHREGRSVLLLQFSSGLKLVYKPKSLAVDIRFQQLLQWMNAKGVRHAHRVLTVLDRGSYGWVEYVETASCDSREALQRFYWRQGSSLALLHTLAAVDFHLENLIAAGEHPVLVDLEALFHQRSSQETGDSAHQRAWAALDRSIISVGMLPMLIFGRGGRAGVDMSGLGGEAGQLSPQAVPMVEDALHDTMRVVRRQGRTSGSSNRPQLQGQPADAAEYTEDIVQGFEETYRLLMRHREELGPRLQDFADVEVRHIVRATQRYALLLQESVHPDFLRDGLERDKVLDNLWAEATLWPSLRRLVPYEHADLRLGDIPMFTTRPGQRHLWSSTGECIRDYFAHDSLGEVRERLTRLDERDCAWQVSLIRKSMVSLDKGRGAAPVITRTGQRPPPAPASREECLAAAISIAEDLAAKAIRGRTDVSWIGMNLEDLGRWRWSLAPLGTDVYEGVGGLALFLAYLARETGRADFEQLAHAALEPVRDSWRNPDPSDAGVGAFVGRTSAAYVLGHLAALWNQPELLDEVREGLPALEALIDTDTRIDLLSGSAGCALVLLGLHARTGDSRFLEAARRCGERLAVMAQPMPEGGLGWKGAAGERPLSGFSHGAAGIAYALLELAAATGDTRYRELAQKGLAYERALFVPERANWRDLREPEKGAEGIATGFMVSWCHGAPGIALGRLCSLRHQDDVQTRAELATALDTTLREGFGGNHCLCHGDMGNLEPLYLAGERLGEPRWIRAALERAAHVIHTGRERGWLCGLPRGTETPGLLMGLAGIGYGLLRLAAPERVPSVLSLAMP
ncbi:type 2 lantipeptide synthetase LanM family protein [Archangium violaceum]|uniref:type 2 lanthipeptide synthetase LanM family protein n=1 Tax=Archangium violaceum TaxID=83451 RepID=UPI00195048CD|nr:type 2 lanthipeptide synthetase LanM family protein [Archangium violaceum]QRN93727.1 type 2 lantipeptide synthetase LanM family protein [Archangium violaceum]